MLLQPSEPLRPSCIAYLTEIKHLSALMALAVMQHCVEARVGTLETMMGAPLSSNAAN